MVYKFFSGILVESYGTWLLFQRLDDPSKDSDIPKNVPFAFAINNRNIITLLTLAGYPCSPCVCRARPAHSLMHDVKHACVYLPRE